MKIFDRLYGEFEIKEKAIIEIIESKPIERLGKINQYGAIYQLYPQFFTTRREHSIGVMLLLRKLNASIEEQIAGLIHDVPHTAFSHVIDYVFGNDKLEVSYHEVIQKETYLNSELPQILDKHKLDKEKIFSIDSFSLLEKSLPDLCADRIDYILRDLVTFNLLTKKEVKNILDNLIVFDHEIILQDESAAVLMAEKVISANQRIWSSPYQIYLAKNLSEIIKLSLERSLISLEDLHGTDNRLFRKLKEIKDPEINQLINMLTKDIVVTLNETDYQTQVYTKLRVIDPKVKIEKGIKRLSAINQTFADLKNKYTKKHSSGFKLNIRERKKGEKIG